MSAPAHVGPRLLCLGELLVDMVPSEPGASLTEARAYLWAAGGAPANVAVAAARLGTPSAVVAAVGDDPFGAALVAELERAGVDASDVVRLPRPTAVAFVALGAAGERDFLFYGHDPAHDHLDPERAVAAVRRLADAGEGARCLHFGSVCLARDPAREATAAAIAAARAGGWLVSCDVNVRTAFWADLDEARAVIGRFAAEADVVKLSAEEAAFLAGGSGDAAEAELTDALLKGRARVVVISRGADGATAYAWGYRVDAPAPRVPSVDTTGAGDALTGALLAATLTRPGTWDDAAGAQAVLERACAFAALTTTRRGAIPAYPDAAALEAFLSG
ncbi:MAG TPA: carbohydrate kinase [Trueperaceae bacterium]|nr:carbohydrate kinase [Trueperaceae bacterium]